jgi:hypothetical protein
LKLPAERYLQTTITITGIHNHDPPETVITIDRNPRSRWTGNHDHHRPERAEGHGNGSFQHLVAALADIAQAKHNGLDIILAQHQWWKEQTGSVEASSLNEKALV